MTLIAHYRLDGNADDAFGKFNGVASDVTWVAGKLGQAASFNGSTSYIDSKISPEIFRADVSICMWANFLDDSRGILFGNYNNVGGFAVEKHTSNRLRVYFNGRFDYFTPNNVITTAAWHHLAFVRDTRANQWRVYVDGSLVGSTAWVGAWVMAGMSTVWIGRDIRTGTTTTYGSLDDVRIYDHALSLREVRDLAMGLAVHYPMSAKAQYYENLLRPENNAVNTYHPSYRPASGIAHGSWGASSEVAPPVEGVIVYKVVEDAVDTQNPRYGIRLNATDLALYDKDCILSYWIYLPSQYAGRYVNSEFIVCQNSTGVDWHTVRGYNSTFNFYGAGTIRDQVIERIDFGKLDQWQRIAVRFKPLTANIQLPENGGNDNNVWVAGWIRIHVSGAVSGGTPFHLYISGGQLVRSREAQDWAYGVNQPVLRDSSKQGLDIELLETTPNWIEESPTGRGSYLFTNDATKRIDRPLVDLGSTLTYSCWAKQDSTEGHFYKFIVSSGRDTGNTGVNVLSQSGVITVFYGGGPQGNGILSSGVSVVGVWRHIVFTHDMVNGARLYVDGVLTTTGPARTIDYSQANNRTVIGKMAYSYTSTAAYFPFSGPISDVRFYASALTADQVKELYQQRASLDSQGNFYASMLREAVGYKFVWDTVQPFPTANLSSAVIQNNHLRISTTHYDPILSMYNLGSFDPAIYKVVQYKYRVISGTAGAVQVFFTNAQYTTANGEAVVSASLVSDGDWHVANVMMANHAKWGDSNITGWRLDPCTAAGVTMEIAWVRLVESKNDLSVQKTITVNDVSEVGITDGLVAYYPLNKNAQDYSGNEYDGVVNGAVPVAGGFDGKGAFGFDGVDDYINLDVSHAAQVEITMSLWMAVGTASLNSGVLTQRRAGFHSRGIITAGNEIRAFSRNSAGTWQQVVATVPFVPGQYYHAVLVQTGSVISLFVDGTLRQTLDMGSFATGYGGFFRVGNHTDANLPYQGNICNIKIFNRALTAQEIAVEYKRTGPTKMTQHQGVTYIQGEIKEV